MSSAHPLRPSVIRAGEWFKERDQATWQQQDRKQALERDHSTCAYCLLQCQKFMQVNHIGAEDNHSLENLETVCAACHRVLHLGASASEGLLTVFECKPDLVDMAVIVRQTRALIYLWILRIMFVNQSQNRSMVQSEMAWRVVRSLLGSAPFSHKTFPGYAGAFG